uniref:Uncharacterized protein n=1 Tax=Octopus bimaculoides TaxID=37653 RepID=A0A0L8FRV3_OCTBM
MFISVTLGPGEISRCSLGTQKSQCKITEYSKLSRKLPLKGIFAVVINVLHK